VDKQGLTGKKKVRMTPFRGWHPSGINTSDSDEQKERKKSSVFSRK